MTDPLFIVHSDLPREGPGDRESLDWALSLAPPPRDGRILDAGCGPGADVAGLLAHVPDGEVVAMDSHAPFVEEVRRRHAGDPRVTAVTGDMAAPEGRFDLIWSAGAVYFLGVEAALSGWRAHLAPGGAVAFSELAWKGAERPAEAAEVWAETYPAMQDSEGVLASVAAAGYRVLGSRFLPDAAWEAYFAPLGRRIAALRAEAPDAELAAQLDAETREIALWRAHRDAFGYLQVVAVPR